MGTLPEDQGVVAKNNINSTFKIEKSLICCLSKTNFPTMSITEKICSVYTYKEYREKMVILVLKFYFECIFFSRRLYDLVLNNMVSKSLGISLIPR